MELLKSGLSEYKKVESQSSSSLLSSLTLSSSEIQEPIPNQKQIYGQEPKVKAKAKAATAPELQNNPALAAPTPAKKAKCISSVKTTGGDALSVV